MAREKRDKVYFETGVPQVVAIDPAYPQLKRVTSLRGDPQVMVYFTENRIAWLDLPVAEQIESLRIRPGEPFSICKEEARDGRRVLGLKWTVDFMTRPAPGPQKLAAAGPGGREVGGYPGDNGSHKGGTGASGNGKDGRQAEACPTKVEYAAAMAEFMIAALEVVKAAEAAGAAKGCSVRFTEETVQKLAVTMFIAADKNGWLTWRPQL
jgi:hypothetical protein